MAPSDITCWTEIHGAAAGDPASLERFAARYASVIRGYLGARWRLPDEHDDVEDAAQDVFVECLRSDGPLARAEPRGPGGFRAFLYGITRNVAMRRERRWGTNRERQPPTDLDLEQISQSDAELSRLFDRTWAEMLVEHAMERLVAAADARGISAQQRVEILALRYERGLTPRAIAVEQSLNVEDVYRALERVRQEFESAVLEVLAFDEPGASTDALKRRCIDLLNCLR